VIIEHYIHREILQRLLWLTGLLILILASNRFVDYLADAAAGKLASGVIFNMLWLKVLAMQPQLLPLALFIAVILTYSRMNRDNELTIFMVSGLGSLYHLKVVSRFAIVFCVIMAVISFFTSPWAEARIEELKIRSRKESDISGLSAGQFREFSEGERVVFVEKISDDKLTMENVFLQIRQNRKLGVLTSDRARFDIDKNSDHKFLVFENGRRYLGTPGMLDYQITEYDKYGVLIETQNPVAMGANLEALPTSVLLLSHLPMHRAELQWRLSSVLACLFLALLAVLLNQPSVSDRRYALLLTAILIYFLYSNLLGISKTLLKRDEITHILGLWWVHVLMILVILLLYYLPILIRRRRRNVDIQLLPAEE
jgi:lipopolysaccharide export system permease protein